VKSFSRRQRWLLTGTLLLAFGLRLIRLGADSLWYDETVSAFLSSQSLTAMWAHTAGDIHPPLYYALLHFWTQAAGRSEFAYAFFSVGFGILLLPLIAQLGRRLYGANIGILAAFLYAINPFSVWYAQEVRMYTLGTFLLGCLLWLTWSLLQSATWPRRTLFLYAVTAALALWSLYYTAFALVALNLFVIWWLWRHAKSQLPAWLLTQVGALLLYLPWLPHALRQALHPPVPPWRDALPLTALIIKMVRESSTALALGQSVDARHWWPFALILLGIALLPLFRMPAGKSRTASWFLAVTLLGPLFLIFLFSQLLTPLYHVRYVYLYSTAYPLLLAVGLVQVAERVAKPRSWLHPLVLTSFLLIISLFSAQSLQHFYSQRYRFEAADDLRGAVQFIYDRIGPRDAILINAGYLYPALLTYWPDSIAWLGRLSAYPPPSSKIGTGPVVVTTGHIDGDPSIGWGDPNSDFYAIDHETAAAKLNQLFADFNTVWVLRGYDTVNDPAGFIRSWLQEHGTLYLDQVFPGLTYVRVQAWRTTPTLRTVPPSFAYPLSRDFRDGIRLLGFDLEPAIPQPGRPLRLTLYWQRRGTIDRSWKVFTQLLDADWQVVAQNDAIPLLGTRPTDQWQPHEVVESTFILHPPPSLSPGAYRLITGFYDESTGKRLPLSSGEDIVVLQNWQLQP